MRYKQTIKKRYKPKNGEKTRFIFRGFESIHKFYLDRIALIRNNEAVAGRKCTSITRTGLKRAIRREEDYARSTRYR